MRRSSANSAQGPRSDVSDHARTPGEDQAERARELGVQQALKCGERDGGDEKADASGHCCSERRVREPGAWSSGCFGTVTLDAQATPNIAMLNASIRVERPDVSGTTAAAAPPAPATTRASARIRHHSPPPSTPCAGSVGGAGHRPRFHRLGAERGPGQGVGHEVDPQDLRRQQRKRYAEERAGEHHEDLGRAAGQAVEQESPDVVVDPATLLDGSDKGGELVVPQHQVGGLTGDLAAPLAHGDADVGASQGGPVIDPVPRHRDDVALMLPEPDCVKLVGGPGPGDDVDVEVW